MENIILLKSQSTENIKRSLYIRNTIMLPGLIIFSQFYFFQPILSRLSKTMDISPAVSSFAVSFTMIGTALGLFVSIFFVDMFPRKKVMVISLLLSSLLSIISSISRNYEVLMAFSFVKGIVVSGVLSVALVYISEEVTNSNKGTIIGLYLTGNVLGGMLGRIIASIFSDLYNWRVAIILIGLIGLVLLIPFLKYFPNSSNYSPKKTLLTQKLAQLKTLFRSLSFLRLIAIIVLNMGVFVSIYNYLSFRLKATPFLLSERFISWLFIIYILGVLGTIITGNLSNRILPRKLLKILILLFLISLMTLLAANIWIVIFGLTLLTFSMFGIQSIISKLISENNIETKSMANCIYLICSYTGASIIGSFSGYILSNLGWAIFVFTLIIMIASSWILVALKKITF